MKCNFYTDTQAFKSDTWDILTAHERQNKSLLNALGYNDLLAKQTIDLELHGYTDPYKVFATITEDGGRIALVAVCYSRFDKLYLYETDNKPNNEAVVLLAEKLNASGCKVTGIRAEQGLAQRFAQAFGGDFDTKFTLIAMRLDKVLTTSPASGFCRLLNEGDIHFAPYWQKACHEECNLGSSNIKAQHLMTISAIEAKARYIWDDNGPVSQVHLGDETQTGAFIDDVYTPPYYRKKGYASALVAAVSQILLGNGKEYCALVADSDNTTSCGIYRKIGYRDVCVMEELEYTERQS
jgi:predicted GNAT family acetyltransferase